MLIWVIITILGGGTFGVMMIIGSMLYAGKWTLPGSAQRKIQAAQVQTKISSFEADAAENRQRVAEINFNTDLKNLANQARLDAIKAQMQDGVFQKELEAGRKD